MTWYDVLKMPPIRNPQADRWKNGKNDDLTMPEYEELFREVGDPLIVEANERDSQYAIIPLDKLEMGRDRALEVAKELYADMGYKHIWILKPDLILNLR